MHESMETSIVDRAGQYMRLMRLDRPIGALLLLWPTLWAIWIAAEGDPQPHILLIFVFGVFLMRSAGCVINDYADRDMDPHVERTRDRPLAARRVSTREALILFLVLMLVALLLVSSLNRLTILLSLAGAFWAVIYPFMKRFIEIPQLVLGFAFSWGIPMAFAAQTGSVPAIAWVLLAGNLCWVLAYDTQYAMADREDDLTIGVKSTAILFGQYDRLMVGIFQALAILLLVYVGVHLSLDVYYFGGLAMASIAFAYQQYLIRDRQSGACFQAFLNNTWAGAAVFFWLVLSYL